MKILSIGDIHGRDIWKEIVAKETFDKVIFHGDYFDSFDINSTKQKENFKDIIAFKKANMNKIVLLMGNHDYHYLGTTTEHYSGFQTLQKIGIQELLHAALDEDLMQVCFVYENVIFSHAGVTQTWCRNNFIEITNLEKSINDLFKFKPNSFEFTVGINYSMYGDDIEQSPIWVRPGSLLKDRIEGYTQVVGHTRVKSLDISNQNNIILVDILDIADEYLIYENGNFNKAKL